jgi:hypothetical protein
MSTGQGLHLWPRTRDIDFLRRADWLTTGRLRTYAQLLAATMLVILLGMAVRLGAEAAADPRGRTAVTDFDAFWSGARLAAAGQAEAAYREPAISAMERRGARIEGRNYLPYLYPPVFLLLCLPLAALPYLAAMAAFLAGGYAVTAACLKRILPAGFPWLPVLAFPGAVMNAIIGQNGFVSATCFAGALLLLPRRPALSGACLGVFAFKPHLAIAVPLALAAARRWRAVFGCAAVAAGLALLSIAAFGLAPWLAFLQAFPVTRAALETHPEIWTKLVSIYGACRILHFGPGAALAVQGVVALLSLAALARICAARQDPALEMAALVVVALICTPYAMDYDLVCLGVPLAWFCREACRTGWRSWEKALLSAAYILPLAPRWLNIHAHLPVAPLAIAGMLTLLWRRATAPVSVSPGVHEP